MKRRVYFPALLAMLVASTAFSQDVAQTSTTGERAATTATASSPTDKARPETIATLRHGRLSLEDRATVMDEAGASAKAGKPWTIAVIFQLPVIYSPDDAESSALVAAAFKQEADSDLAAEKARIATILADIQRDLERDMAASQQAVATSLQRLEANQQRQQRAADKRRRDEEYCRHNPMTPYSGALAGFLNGLHGCPSYVPPPPRPPLTCYSNLIGDTVFTNCY